MSNAGNYITLYGRLKDKFGDNGLVSVIIASVKAQSLHIDLWLMSCRVIRRGLEYAMFDELINTSRKKGIKQIIGYYFKTPKNSIVARHYQDMGFKLTSEKENEDSVWKYDIGEKVNKTNHIIEVNCERNCDIKKSAGNI